MSEYITEWSEFIEQNVNLYQNGNPEDDFFNKAIINYTGYIRDNENDWYGYHCRGIAYLFLRDRMCAKEDLRVSYDLARCSDNYIAQVVCGIIMQFLFVIGYADIVEEVMGGTFNFSANEVTLEMSNGSVITVPSFLIYENYQRKGNVAELPFKPSNKSDDSDIVQEIEALIGEQ